jgi:hypothetical protein
MSSMPELNNHQWPSQPEADEPWGRRPPPSTSCLAGCLITVVVALAGAAAFVVLLRALFRAIGGS